MSLIQLLKFKTWETRLFKMPRFETPCFKTGIRVTVASGHSALKTEESWFTAASGLGHAPFKARDFVWKIRLSFRQGGGSRQLCYS